MIFILIIIFIIHQKFRFLFIIVNIHRLFFNFVIILERNKIGDEGAKALSEALKLIENLTNIDLGIFLRLLQHSKTVILSLE